MASVVCQGLQSCLEPQIIEWLVLRQNLSPPPTPKSKPITLPSKPEFQEINGERNNDNNGGCKNSGWSFLKALENPSSHGNTHDKTEEVYVHPMVKRSASALSTKSLEMCTESLGSETGSDASESGDEFCSLSWEERERVRAIQRSKYRIFDRKVRIGDFPPPLTSISGSDGTVKVRHHREGGRLVIKAVSFSNCGTNFQAERTNGRLRLSLLRNRSVNYESEWVKMEEDEEGGEVESENEYVISEEEDDDDQDLYDDDDDDDDEVVAEVEEMVAVEEEEEEGGGVCGWDRDGNRWKVGCETGMLTRCKEGGNGNKEFAHWGSFWVPIS